MEPQQGISVTAKLILSFALGLFVGVGSLWFFTEKLSLKKEPEESVAPESSNSITVSDQAPGSVVFADVVLEETGWVVIHEDRGGSPGNILGAQRFDPGEGSGTVELLRGTTEGGLYYAMLHGDDGDGAFDYTSDLPLKDASGNVVSASFRARSVSQP